MAKYIFSTLLFLCVSLVHLQSQTLYKINKDERYGYIDKNTNDTIISCKYICAYTDSIEHIGFVFDDDINRIVCFNNKGERLFYVLNIDNGPDYIKEGLFRITDKRNLIGFADSLGNIVIPPVFKFAYPFNQGKAKVTFTGKSERTNDNEHNYWNSNEWFYISKADE